MVVILSRVIGLSTCTVQYLVLTNYLVASVCFSAYSVVKLLHVTSCNWWHLSRLLCVASGQRQGVSCLCLSLLLPW